MLKIKDDVDMKTVFSNWKETDDYYYLEDNKFDEFVEIDKTSRVIVNNGFNCLLLSLMHENYIEVIEKKPCKKIQKTLKRLDIYFSDLNPDAQQAVLDIYGISCAKEGNFDIDIVPICTLEIEEDA